MPGKKANANSATHLLKWSLGQPSDIMDFWLEELIKASIIHRVQVNVSHTNNDTDIYLNRK
jgi:hypothetical protein